MKFKIKVTEILSRTITVEADTEEKAIGVVSDMYNNEEIVLDYSDFDNNVMIEKTCAANESNSKVEN